MTTIIFVTLNVRLIKPFSVRFRTNKKLVQSIKIDTASLKSNEQKKLTLFVSLSFFLCLDKIVSFSLSYVGLSCRVFKRAFSLLTQCSVANKAILHCSFFFCLSVCVPQSRIRQQLYLCVLLSSGVINLVGFFTIRLSKVTHNGKRDTMQQIWLRV